MDKPRHGFDRNASHNEDRYVCDCGYEDCAEADKEWMDWAEKRIAELEAESDLNRRKAAEISGKWLESKNRIAELREALDQYRNGYKGACYCCELVGEKNVEQEKRIAELEAEVQRLHETMETVAGSLEVDYYPNQLCAIRELREALKNTEGDR